MYHAKHKSQNILDKSLQAEVKPVPKKQKASKCPSRNHRGP